VALDTELSQERPFLSIIIPAFNEERILPASLTRVVDFVETRSFRTEVIVVDNDSSDLTGEIVRDFASRYPFIKYSHEVVRGKGAAVRAGMLAGQGDYLLMSDADLAVPIEEADGFLPPQLNGYDIAIASREIKGAKRHNEPFRRHLTGRAFNFVIRTLVLPDIEDTQCGFKCFRREVALDLFGRSTITGWSFDVEILYTAALKGYKIVEVPVNWYYGEQSKVSLYRDGWRVLKEIVELRKRRIFGNDAK
jgi:dolichyl-phosphate beta-glucosyltransferase